MPIVPGFFLNAECRTHNAFPHYIQPAYLIAPAFSITHFRRLLYYAEHFQMLCKAADLDVITKQPELKTRHLHLRRSISVFSSFLPTRIYTCTHIGKHVFIRAHTYQLTIQIIQFCGNIARMPANTTAINYANAPQWGFYGSHSWPQTYWWP